MIKDGPSSELEMPIDQYGRYKTVAQIVKDLKKRSGQKKVKILDIGGSNGETHRFFSPDEAEITIIDLDEARGKNYVRGSALDMPFENKSFDYAVSFEVLEHIPREHRATFIQEAMRICKGEFILTAPFAGKHDEVFKSEIYVNKLWKNIHHQNHKWLCEHIEYRTPKTEDLEKILKQQNLKFQKIGNNDLLAWNLMLSFSTFTTIFEASGLNPDIQAYYNEHAQTIDSNTDFYYRFIYVIGRDSSRVGSYSIKQIPVEEKIQTLNLLIHKLFITMSNYILEKNLSMQKIIDDCNKELDTSKRQTANLHARLNQNEDTIKKLNAAIKDIGDSKVYKLALKARNLKNKLGRHVK